MIQKANMNRKIYTSAHEVLSILPDRTQDILIRRLGIGRRSPETLESIGQTYGITRERVRQIEDAGFKSLKQSNALQYLRPILNKLNEFMQEHGAVMEENFLISTFHAESGLNQRELSEEEGCIRLFLELAEEFNRHKVSQDFHSHWSVEERAREVMRQVLQFLTAYFQRTGKLLSLEQVVELMKRQNLSSSPKPVRSYLEISRQIDQNIFGEWGLSDWAEVRPRGIRDKSYLVLRNIGKPLHFREVAEQINRLGLSNRPALPQTVHNELIKDSRFVLVGRGIYALGHWGYQPGTVKDVLIGLLKENGPMSQKELIEATLKQRQVRPNTILLNLNNRAEFRKLSDGRYTLNS